MKQETTLKVDSPDFPYSVQQMIVYMCQERGDPSRHMDWDKYEPMVKRDWPEFYAAWLADGGPVEDSDLSTDETHAALQAQATRVKAALDALRK